MPKVSFTITKDALEVLLLVFATLLAVTVMASIAMDVRPIGFKLVPMWVILITLCLVSRGQGLLGVLVALILCGTSEYVCWFDKPSAVKWEKIPPVIICDLLMILPLGLLTATRLDNAASEHERECLGHRRRQEEAEHLLKALRASREEAEDPKGTKGTKRVSARDQSVEQKKVLLMFSLAAYQEIFAIRYRRDVPRVVESLFRGSLGVDQGAVFEVGEGQKELRLRNHWGVAAGGGAGAITVLSENKDNALFRWAIDKKESMGTSDFRKDMSLLDAHEDFSRQAFPVDHLLPVVSQNRTVFLLVLGPASGRSPIPFDGSQIRTLVSCIGASLVKVDSKDVRPKFSMFNPGDA